MKSLCKSCDNDDEFCITCKDCESCDCICDDIELEQPDNCDETKSKSYINWINNGGFA